MNELRERLFVEYGRIFLPTVSISKIKKHLKVEQIRKNSINQTYQISNTEYVMKII